MYPTPTNPAQIGNVAIQFTWSLIDRFELLFEIDRGCQSLLSGFQAAGHSPPPFVEVDVLQLAATAALRHFGTAYHARNPQDSIQKEQSLWAGWLDHKPNRQLQIAQAIGGHNNSGRVSEVGSSLAEAIALDAAIWLFGVPYGLWLRIPEHPGGMDFRAPYQGGVIAIEAKACLGARGRAAAIGQINNQKNRQVANHKYGFVLCYERAGVNLLQRKGSYLYVVDPPGELEPIHADEIAYLKEHYLQVFETLGMWPLLWLMSPSSGAWEGKVTPADAERSIHMKTFGCVSASINGTEYRGWIFRYDKGAESQLQGAPFVFAVANQVVDAVINGQWTLLLAYNKDKRFEVRGMVEGSYGPMAVAGTSDGLVRIELTSMEQALNESLTIRTQPSLLE